MQITGIDTQVETNFNSEEGTAFSLEATAHAFKILSSSMYTYKIAAVCRELFANALDAHIALGNTDKPFRVVIPNDFHPYFEVEDYGIGMSLETIKEVYTVMFKSTKSATNDAVGGFGIGSKSAFAYTRQFTIRSRHAGIETTALVHMDKSGMPFLDVVASFPTTEPSGTKVTIPVSPKDYQEFENESSYFMSFYEVTPTCNIDMELMYEGVGELLAKDDSAYMARSNQRRAALASSNFYAVMGPIAYPVEIMNFVTDPTVREFLKYGMNSNNIVHGRGYHSSGHQALFVRFGIGELELAASREALSLDEDTMKMVVNRFAASAVKKAEELIVIANDTTKHPLEIIDAINKEFGEFGMFLNLARQKSPRLDKYMRKVFKFKRLNHLQREWGRGKAYKSVNTTFDFNFIQRMRGRTLHVLQFDTDKPRHNSLLEAGQYTHEGLMNATKVARIEKLFQLKIELTKYSDIYNKYLADRRAARNMSPARKYEKTNISAAFFVMKEKGLSDSQQRQRIDVDVETMYYVNMNDFKGEAYWFSDDKFTALWNFMVSVDPSLHGTHVIRHTAQNAGKIAKMGLRDVTELVNWFGETYKDEVHKQAELLMWNQIVAERTVTRKLLHSAKAKAIPAVFHDLYDSRNVATKQSPYFGEWVLKQLGGWPKNKQTMMVNYQRFWKKNIDFIADEVYSMVSTFLKYDRARFDANQELVHEVIKLIDDRRAEKKF